MKKEGVLLFTAIIFCSGLFAQTAKVKSEEKTLKNSIAEKKVEKHEAGKDLANFRVKSTLEDRKKIRRHRRNIHRQGEHLRKHHGVKHPIRSAKIQAKKEKDIKNSTD